MKIIRPLCWALLIIVLAEIALRVIWGFGTPVLYTESKNYEYIYSPNQSVRRYGNLINTNSFGMRSSEPSQKDSIRILYLGDSVINGGMPTDQDDLSSTLLSKKLSDMFKKPVNVLNISAGSWGPDNAAAFLKEHGTFQADAIVVLFSSHDAYDNMDFEPIVNRNMNYPGENPKTAISEVFLRYFLPSFSSIFGMQNYTSNKLMINTQNKVFNSGWMELKHIADNDSIPILYVLHAEQKEINKQRFNKYGKQILDTLQSKNLTYYTDLEWGISTDCYRDFIHPNQEGQLFIANHLLQPIANLIRNSSKNNVN
jgi:lysophospholipase L1-like esterase